MIGIIGGTSLSVCLAAKAQSKVVETPYGEATAVLGQAGERPVAFIPRHGAAHGVPPHRGTTGQTSGPEDLGCRR